MYTVNDDWKYYAPYWRRSSGLVVHLAMSHETEQHKLDLRKVTKSESVGKDVIEVFTDLFRTLSRGRP